MRADYATVLLKALARDKHHAEAIALIERERKLLQPAVYDTIRATVLRRAGRIDEAQSSIRAALAVAIDSSDETLKANVADELTAQRLWREALSLWKTLAKPTHFGPDSQSALRCAWHARDDVYLLEFSAALRKNGCFDAAAFHMEINKLIEYNAPNTAIKAMTAYLANPTEVDPKRWTGLRVK